MLIFTLISVVMMKDIEDGAQPLQVAD